MDSSTASGSSAISVPATAQVGDLAVLFDSTASSPTPEPTGWTTIYSEELTFEFRVSYKILEPNYDTTVTGVSNNQYYSVKTMLVFRPSSTASNVLVNSLEVESQQQSTPAPISISSSPYAPTTIVFAMVRAYQNQPFIDEATWDSEFYNLSSGNAMKVFYELQSENIARTVTTSADYGSYNFAIGFTINAE